MIGKKFTEIALEMGELVTLKNQAYGNSFAKTEAFLRLLYPDGIQVKDYRHLGFFCRMFDKMVRIATNQDAFGESPYRDVIGYGLIAAQLDEAIKEAFRQVTEAAMGRDAAPEGPGPEEVPEPGMPWVTAKRHPNYKPLREGFSSPVRGAAPKADHPCEDDFVAACENGLEDEEACSER